MFNSSSNTNLVTRSASTKINRTFKKLALIAVIATASVGAQANELSSADVVSALETRFTEATTEMLQTATQEITLNLQSHIAEQLFELSTSLELTESVTESDTALVSKKD